MKKITIITLFVLLIIIPPHGVYAGKDNNKVVRTFKSPFDNSKCVETCNLEKKQCLLETYNNEGRHVGTYQFQEKIFKVNWHSSELVEFVYKGDSTINDSFFYSMVTTRGEYIRNLLSLSPDRTIVVYAEDQNLIIRPIFKRYKIIKKIGNIFSSSRDLFSSIREVGFKSDEKLQISYVSGPNNILKKEIVEVFDELRKRNEYNENYPLMTLVKSIKASSFLKEKNTPGYSYHPVNLYDEDLNSAWFEGVKGDGKGEYVEFQFFTPINITRISFHNGYYKSDSLFKKNGRVKTLDIRSDRGDHLVISLKDDKEKQEFSVNFKDVQTLKLTILDVFEGSKYKDTGISEIRFKSTISQSFYKNMSEEKFSKIMEFHNSNVDYNGNSDFKDISQFQMHRFLIQDFSGLDGCGNDDRLISLTRAIIKNRYLIPPLLKAVYEKRRAYFFTEAGDSGYMDVVKMIWDKNPESIPLLSHSGSKDYSGLYYRLMLGDTRVLPEYIDFLIVNGIWHEACCDIMPGTLIVKSKDGYTKKALMKIMESKREMPDEVLSELKRAVSQISN